MEITAILDRLGTHTGEFPRKEIEEAIRKREEITPELLRVLEEAIEWVCDHGFDNEEAEHKCGACNFILYLLSQFREQQAYPLVVALGRLPENSIEFLIGDTLTEALDRILASVCGGDTSLIKDLIEDPEVNEYVRAAAVSALIILVAVGEKSRDDIMDYYKSLFHVRLERSYSFVWDKLISCAVRLHPEDVYEEIVATYNEGLGDSCFMNMEDVDKVRKMSQEKVLARLTTATPGYIEDTVKEMHWWVCFNEEKYKVKQKPTHAVSLEDFYRPASRPALKIGPNDPCTCGSGRKHKKCCGRIA